jgi:hypothetical protein
MIRNLPEGSRYASCMTVDRSDELPDETRTPDPRTEAVMDQRAWTLDRRLKAIEINAIYSLIAVSGDWGKKGPPSFPTIGPASWQPDNQKSKEPELRDNFDVLRKMGWTGGS